MKIIMVLLNIDIVELRPYFKQTIINCINCRYIININSSVFLEYINKEIKYNETLVKTNSETYDVHVITLVSCCTKLPSWL